MLCAYLSAYLEGVHFRAATLSELGMSDNQLHFWIHFVNLFTMDRKHLRWNESIFFELKLLPAEVISLLFASKFFKKINLSFFLVQDLE